jgi:hypothetical protein
MVQILRDLDDPFEAVGVGGLQIPVFVELSQLGCRQGDQVLVHPNPRLMGS